jgi:hypothetical protein
MRGDIFAQIVFYNDDDVGCGEQPKYAVLIPVEYG